MSEESQPPVEAPKPAAEEAVLRTLAPALRQLERNLLRLAQRPASLPPVGHQSRRP